MPEGTTRRRARRTSTFAAPLVLLLVALVGLVIPASADALSLRRTWHASFGASGGTARLLSYTTGIGSLRVSARSLRATTAYSVTLNAGSCASTRVITKLPTMTTDSAGAINRTIGVSATRMNAVWTVARTGTMSIRLASSAGTACAMFTFEVATRIAFPGLGIDLPIVKPPSGYPLCNVAMYIKEISQPREAGVTLIYAHARTGMFLPLLTASKINNGASLIGRTVRVWTSDSVLSTYRIDRVRRHVTSLDGIFAVTREELWIQTSEGPRGTTQKLILVAHRIGSVPASYAASHPSPHPIVCG